MSIIQPSVTDPDSPLRVAVVGCGYWGPNLIRNFYEHPQAQLVAVCDRDAARLEKVRDRYPAVRLTTVFESLLEADDVDAVVIATPVHTHYPLAKAALLAGKHVMIEKPMCQTSDQCRELITLAEQQGKTLMVGHTFVYHGAVQQIRDRVAAGELGDILYFDSVRVNLGLFQSDINVVWDLAPHDLSMMDTILGRTPHTLHASGACHTASGLEDIAYLTLHFEDNLIAHFHVSWLSPVKIRQMLIGGSKQMLVYDDLAPTEKIRLYDKGIQTHSVDSDEARYQQLVQYRTGDMRAPVVDTTEALQTEAGHFIECVLTGQTPLTDGVAGLRVVQMLEAADRSLKTGEVQKLQLPERREQRVPVA